MNRKILKRQFEFSKNLGDIDILGNNCGGHMPGYFEDLYDDSWQALSSKS